MKRILPIFLSALVGGLSLSLAQDKPAHKDAMSALDCSRCHTCEYPTADNPCLVSCPRIEAVRETATHEVDEGPDSVVLDKLAALYEPVIFDHKQHADMSKMGGDCSTCHHYSPPGRIPPCGECHDAEKTETNLRMPSLKGAYHRQCIACHREWSHDTKCVVCHLPKEGTKLAAEVDPTDILGVAHPRIVEPDIKLYHTPYEPAPVVTFFHKEHIDLFGPRCVDCHRQENCSRCHDMQKTVQVQKTPEEVHAICNDCHGNDACAKCHDVKQRPPFTHASTGWPLNRFHQDLDCRSCHPSGRRIARLDSDCNNCHGGWNQGHFRHAVTGLQLDEMHIEFDCVDCHVNRNFSAAPTCDNCHDDGRTAYDVPPGERVTLQR